MTTSHSPRQQRIATGYLVLATTFWGASFTWAKFIGDYANHALGFQTNNPAGPLLMLGLRFTFAAIVWFVLFPQARRGWSMISLRRGAGLGAMLAIGMIFQMLGLDRTTANVSSFLTALTVLFVPLVLMVWSRRSPSKGMWISVGIATIGIWLLTGAAPTGFGLGEVLGLGCSIVFSFYLIAVNATVPLDNPFRMTGLTMLVTGAMALLLAGALILHSHTTMDWRIPIAAPVWPRLALLVFLPTVAAFGILTYYQPRIDPTRAALIYLCEPIFTAIYDYIEMRHTLSPIALTGAALIVLANVLVESLSRLRGTPDVVSQNV